MNMFLVYRCELEYVFYIEGVIKLRWVVCKVYETLLQRERSVHLGRRLKNVLCWDCEFCVVRVSGNFITFTWFILVLVSGTFVIFVALASCFFRRQHDDWAGYVLSFFQLNYFYNIWRTERDTNRVDLLKRENYLWLSSLASTCSKSLPFTVLTTYIVVAEVETGAWFHIGCWSVWIMRQWSCEGVHCGYATFFLLWYRHGVPRYFSIFVKLGIAFLRIAQCML